MYRIVERSQGHAVVTIDATGERFTMSIPAFLPTEAHRTQYVKDMATQRSAFVLEEIHQARLRYRLLPWWRKIFTKKPK